MSGPDYFEDNEPAFVGSASWTDEIDPFTSLRTNRTPLAQITDEQFLHAIFGSAHYAHAWVADYGNFGGGFAPATLPTLNQTTSRYYSVAAIRAGSPSRKLRYAEAVHVLVLDDVGDTSAAGSNITPISGARLDWNVVKDLPIAPTFVVETSKGNFQVGYVLTQPETDLRRWDRFLKALQARRLWATKFHGSGSVHYFRLPSGQSHKPEKANFRTHLTWFEPGHTYTETQLAIAFGIPNWQLPPPQATALPDPSRERLPNATITAILGVVPNDVCIFEDENDWNLFGQEIKGAAADRDDPILKESWVKWSLSWNGPWNRGVHKDPGEMWDRIGADTTYAGSLRHHLGRIIPHPLPGDPNFDLREAAASAIDALDLHPQSSLPAGTRFQPQLPPPSPEPAPVSLPDDLADLFEQLRLARPTPAVYAVPPSRTGESFDPNSLGNLEVINPHVMGYYTRGRTTMLLAVPGAGKSSLMASTAAALLFERPDIVDEPDAGFPGSAVLVSNEDDKAIIAGKLRALMDYHHLQPASALHEVLLFNGIKLLTRDSSGVFHLACVSFLKELIELRKRRDVALIVFDTLISLTRGVEENSNEQMQVVLEFFTRLAAAAHAAVVIIHHVSKSGLSKDGEIGIYGGRGASSMAADMRSTIQVLKPSPADRDEYKWSDTAAKAWVKVLPLKGSYDDPSTWVPKWFHFRSVLRPALDIRNPALPSLRAFGVLVPETPIRPSPQAAFGSLNQQARQAWGVLDAALNQGQVWNLKTRSKSKAVAKVLLGRDFEATKELLDILIGWGVMVIPNQETQEIIKVVGVMLPETEPESDRNLDRNLEE